MQLIPALLLTYVQTRGEYEVTMRQTYAKLVYITYHVDTHWNCFCEAIPMSINIEGLYDKSNIND